MSFLHALLVGIACAAVVIPAILFLDPIVERIGLWWEGKVDRWWAGREGR